MKFTLILCALASLMSAAEPPNIVFIYADDLGFGDLACHGHPRIQTPNLDRMAREGTDFHSFMVVSPVCSPSRTGIVTGQFPSRWGVHQHFATHDQNVARHMPDWLDPGAPLLPRVLKQAGYRTAHFGKWHLSGGAIDGAPLPSAYGYDAAAVWTGPGAHVLDGTDHGLKLGDASAHDPQAASWISTAATDHALRFIRESGNKPFYLNLWLHETHHLVSATEDDKKPYPDVDEPQRTYDAAVTRADRQVGRVLALLDELGIAHSTLVMFSSDNGPENSHTQPGQKFYFSQGSTGGLRGRKRSLLMGGLNVPFIVRWPGVVPKGRVDRETALAGVDVFPTVLAACGVKLPEGYKGDGENMLPAFKGEKQTRSKPVFWWWQGGHSGDDWPAYAMREGSRVLILDETKNRAELYDVVTDRAQSKNLAETQPETVKTMRDAIDAWLATLPGKTDPAMQTKAISRTPPSQAAKPAAVTPETRMRAFKKWDKNKDNVLTLDEYRNGLSQKDHAESRHRNFDKNEDGRLTLEEFVGQPAR